MSECSARECHLDSIDGGTVCERHGGLAPQVRQAAQVAVAERTMARFTKPLPAHRLSNPASALWEEYERTQARLAWLDDQIGTLTEEEATWGKTKHETAGGFEGGSNTTFEARLHPWIVLQDRERKHLLEVEKVMASKTFKDARDAMETRASEYVMGLLDAIVTSLGRKPTDPKVRRRIGAVLAEKEPRLLRALDEALGVEVLDGEVLEA